MTTTTAGIAEATVLRTFLALVGIDSPSGQEQAVAAYPGSRELQRLGCQTWRDGTGNLLARRPGAGLPGRRAPAPPQRPHGHGAAGRGDQAPGRGRGSSARTGRTILGADDKAGITAILEALRAVHGGDTPGPPPGDRLHRGGRDRPLRVEGARPGTLQSRQAVVLDSNGPVGTIVNQAPASDHIEATVIGRAAHAGVAPEEGINALVAAARALAGMRLGRIDPQTTANFGVIRGGTASNVVPERVELVGEARSRSESALEAQTRHMVASLEEAAAAVGARAEVRVSRAYGKIDVPPDSPLIQSVSAAIRACGLEPLLQPTGGGSDANVLNAAGITAVNLGTGYTGPHSLDEQVAVADLVKITEVVRALITAP